MLKLLAYAADERWAYVQEGDRRLLLRPPYQHETVVSDTDVEYAVTVHGYQASERPFESREELRAFLREESTRVWRERNPPVDPAVLRERLLAARAAETPGPAVAGHGTAAGRTDDREAKYGEG